MPYNKRTPVKASSPIPGMMKIIRETDGIHDVYYDTRQTMHESEQRRLLRLNGARERDEILFTAVRTALSEIASIPSITSSTRFLINAVLTPLIQAPPAYHSPETDGARAPIVDVVSVPPPQGVPTVEDISHVTKFVKKVVKPFLPPIIADNIDEIQELAKINLVDAMPRLSKKKRALATPDGRKSRAKKQNQPLYDDMFVVADEDEDASNPLAVLEEISLGGAIGMKRISEDPYARTILGIAAPVSDPLRSHRATACGFHSHIDCNVCHWLLNNAHPDDDELLVPSSNYSALIAVHYYVKTSGTKSFEVFHKELVAEGYFTSSMLLSTMQLLEERVLTM